MLLRYQTSGDEKYGKVFITSRLKNYSNVYVPHSSSDNDAKLMLSVKASKNSGGRLAAEQNEALFIEED